jgi:hypothetical protein
LEGLYTALEERLRERLRAMKEGKDASVQDRIKQVSCALSLPSNSIHLRY